MVIQVPIGTYLLLPRNYDSTHYKAQIILCEIKLLRKLYLTDKRIYFRSNDKVFIDKINLTCEKLNFEK